MRTCPGFLILLKIKKKMTQKLISGGKEMSRNMIDTEIEYASVEDSLNIHRPASNETTLVSEILNIIMSQMLSFHQGKEKYKF